MVLTLDDYIAAYNSMFKEYNDEILPGLVQISRTMNVIAAQLHKYREAAEGTGINVNPYEWPRSNDNFRTAVHCSHIYLGGIPCPNFYALVATLNQWAGVRILNNPTIARQASVSPSEYHKGLLWWRSYLNQVKDGITQFNEWGAKATCALADEYINEHLLPKADKEAREFFAAMGMTQKLKRVTISVVVTEEE